MLPELLSHSHMNVQINDFKQNPVNFYQYAHVFTSPQDLASCGSEIICGLRLLFGFAAISGVWTTLCEERSVFLAGTFKEENIGFADLLCI